MPVMGTLRGGAVAVSPFLLGLGLGRAPCAPPVQPYSIARLPCRPGARIPDSMTDKTIIIHSLEHAVAALKVARELGSSVTLASPPGAAAYTGALWFREVVKEAEREVPEADFTAVLDCGDKPGLVMAAFRHGVASVRFTGAKPEAEKLEAMAESEGYHLITGDLESLDLAEAENVTEACRGWLQGSG